MSILNQLKKLAVKLGCAENTGAVKGRSIASVLGFISENYSGGSGGLKVYNLSDFDKPNYDDDDDDCYNVKIDPFSLPDGLYCITFDDYFSEGSAGVAFTKDGNVIMSEDNARNYSIYPFGFAFVRKVKTKFEGEYITDVYINGTKESFWFEYSADGQLWNKRIFESNEKE